MMTLAETVAGTVRGTAADGVVVFRGIPFAAPPTGVRRFAPPESIARWEGERDATEFGPASLQNVDPLSMVVPGAERDYYSPATAQFSEDCLNLNVVTPAVDDGKRPVLVWIHGGGFVTGSGSAEWYDGTNLARKNDAVVVTINYRLGLLGGIYLGDLDPSTSNPGLRDQVAALEWVRSNIVHFGGDPENVTIFGQSAGGMAVCALIVSPLSGGLFHRAIVQSGNVDNFVTVADAVASRDRVLAALKIPSEGDVVAALREVSTLRLLEVQRILSPRVFPVMDGETIPNDPLAAVREGRAADVPLLIGNTAAENKLFHLINFPVPGEGFDLEAAFDDFFGPSSSLAAEGADLYRRSAPSRVDGDLWDYATSDLAWLVATRRLADAHASAGRPTFAFELAIESTAFDGIVGAGHEVDVPFVFDLLDRPGVDELLGSELVGDSSARLLAEHIGSAWVSFAREGVPTLPAIAAWPRWSADHRATVVLDRESEISVEHSKDKLDFWERNAPGVTLLSILQPEAVPEA